MDERDDQIIDLAAYIRRKEEEEEDEAERGTFTLWGGEGERARFALPLWRAAYLAGGRRSALVWLRAGALGEEPEPLIVLDLREEVARLDFSHTAVAGVSDATKPGTFAGSSHGLTVYLGEENERKWYLVIDDLEEPRVEHVARPHHDLLFLAGECAGLLLFKGLAVGIDGWEGGS